MTDYVGLTVKSKQLGFRGVVLSQTKHVTGCDRVAVQPKSSDGRSVPKVEQLQVGDFDVLEDIPRIVLKDQIIDKVVEDKPEKKPVIKKAKQRGCTKMGEAMYVAPRRAF